MSVKYKAVQWNRQKKIYDAVLIGGVAAYLVAFGAVTEILFPRVTEEILLMRAFGTAAFLLLHIILCIGPLCRLNPKFLPLLYNRRHAGVTLFSARAHPRRAGRHNLSRGRRHESHLEHFRFQANSTAPIASMPFQPFGFFALVILFLMAATSHDFWLANLSAPVWKSLHMLVYFAYALLVLHVTFGVLQSETSPVLCRRNGRRLSDRSRSAHHGRPKGNESSTANITFCRDDGFVDACAVADIPENRARIVCSVRRTRGDFQIRRKNFRRLQCLPASERPARRRQNCRRLHHLSVAWLPISAGNRRVAAAVCGKSPDVQCAGEKWPRVGSSQAKSGGNASRTGA